MSYRQNNVTMLVAKSDLGGRIFGSSHAFEALKRLAEKRNRKIFETLKCIEIEPEHNNPTENDPFAKYISQVYELNIKLACEIQKVFSIQNNLIVLSGNHSSAIGTIAGIKSAFSDKRLGVIWIDAHADIHSPFTTPSGNIHGMPLACSLGEDNFDCYKNKPDLDTIKYWDKLKNISSICPKIFYEDLVYIGLRSYEEEEAYLIRKNNIKVFTVSDVRKKSVKTISTETLNYLENCDLLYVSFDIDSLDSNIITGTGCPETNGLYEKEAKDIVYYFLQSPKVAVFEITEVNPMLDKDEKTVNIAFDILENAINHIYIKSTVK